MNRSYKLLLSVVSGLLLAGAWPERGFPFLLFIGLVPLLLVEHAQWNKRNENHSSGFFGYAVFSFLIFNSLTTYWIYNAALVGAVAAILLNTLLMSLVFLLFHLTHRRMSGEGAGYLALIGYWLSFEYLHLRWDLNWPWMNLGHGFASYPQWIQWYEFTGVFGGSLWILLVNISIFWFIQIRFIQKICSRKVGVLLIASLLAILIPVAISIFMYRNYNEAKNPIDVVVVQPNLDPYSEQYELDPKEVTERMLVLADAKADSLTDFIVFPESALQEYAWEDQLDSVGSIRRIHEYCRNFPQMAAVVGMSTRKLFREGEALSLTARKFRDAERYYDAYNTALYISHNGELQKYHKSKLTPGVEKMPYPRLFRFLEKFALDLGGTVGSLATDPVQSPFMVNDSVHIAPVICYESVYGEFVNRFLHNGANVIFVITNDGWWGDTPGHRQHLLFSVIRAIETRRSIARSANTGISCFISQTGDVSQRTAYWEPAAIRSTINLNSAVTFYVKHGDYIARIFLLIAGLFFLLTLSLSLRQRTL